jgi:acetyl-CoA acetyltransferase
MLQGLAVGLLGGALGTALDSVLKDTTAAADGFTIATLDTGKTEETESTYADTMDADAKDALDALREMTTGGIEGYWKWMMKELREDVMGEMGVSEEELAAMPVEQRKAVEQSINDEVEKRLKEAMGVKDGEEGVVNADEMIEKLKQSMQADQAKGAYKEEKGILGVL